MSSESYRSVPVLVVDDDPDLLTAIAATLEPEGFVVTVCSSPVQALALMDSGGYGLVIADNYMPGMTGLQLLACVRERWPHVTRVLITGLLAIDTLITAINSGEIYRFIAKPWNACLAARIEEVSRQKVALDFAHEALERNFERSLDLVYRLTSTFYGLLGTQIQQVVRICDAMAKDERFTPEESRVLRASSWLYDIGFLAFERTFIHRALNHADRLSLEEKRLLKQHPIVGQTLAGFADCLGRGRWSWSCASRERGLILMLWRYFAGTREPTVCRGMSGKCW